MTKPIGRQIALGQPLFELEGITKVYNPDSEQRVEVLHGVSLKIQRGEFVAIMGASGSGKTTLMNILGCLDKPTGGRYLLAGTDVAGLDRSDLAWLRRSVFGFVFQSYNLIGTATAQENVEIPAIYAGHPAAERHRRAAELLGMLGLAERTTHRPNQLSGGQQQRVSIARALMNGGTAILADEPTGALDSTSGAEVLQFLEHLADEGHTVIIITHDAEVARHARRRIEIKDGNIVADVIQSWSEKAPSERPVKALDFIDHAKRLDEFSETLRMALRALRVNLLRTILTLLGIVIGVGSVVAMLAVGDGARQVVLDRIGSMGTDLLLIRPGAPNQRGVGNAIATLVPQDAEAISSLANVRAAVPELSASVTVRSGDSDYQTSATGTTADLTEIRDWPVARGSFFTREDAARYAAVTVLGQTVVNNLFPAGADPVGRFVLVNNVPFQVLGVMAAKGATASGADLDDVVFVPLSTGSLRLFGQRNVKTITVAVDDVDKIDATQSSVTALLAERHKAEDFQIRNMAAVLETAEATQNTLSVLLGSVGAISLLVGGIGVMNIMLVSVTERTREIGIRMATGARTRNILQQFLTEAVVVSIFGGLLGIGCGFAMAAGFMQFGVPAAVSLEVVALAFACAVAVGLVFGFAPALKAARLDPVVALASE
ncbi:MacB family efflux pump subunit [Dongia sedimenti]|uniref:Pyoverdine export ATP-binding/permease protein PvdT n=1 Tax=Dongia sedimenti TaxID=3064282 RepID=A0ABU0YTL0_9PROT|nr:MacB family efflux pump subunit [Rhodospirillaceae bacterium R-7]